MLRESRFNTQLLTIHTKKDIENFTISVFKLSDRCFSYRQKFLKSNAFQFFLQINVRSRTKSPDSEFRPPPPPPACHYGSIYCEGYAGFLLLLFFFYP